MGGPQKERGRTNTHYGIQPKWKKEYLKQTPTWWLEDSEQLCYAEHINDVLKRQKYGLNKCTWLMDVYVSWHLRSC